MSRCGTAWRVAFGYRLFGIIILMINVSVIVMASTNSVNPAWRGDQRLAVVTWMV
jgi:hypothetical protein